MSRYLKRAARAKHLAEQHPESRDALLFFAIISEWQNRNEGLDELRALVRRAGPPVLRRAPADHEWFQRVMAEVEGPKPATAAHDANQCPKCGNPPQLGILRRVGDGAGLWLACCICREEWTFRRTVCPGCGASGDDLIGFGVAEAFPALLTQTCDACWTYIHLIDLGKDIKAIPEADEIAAQPLDIWAMEQGYKKLTPNLIGL